MTGVFVTKDYKLESPDGEEQATENKEKYLENQRKPWWGEKEN